MISLQLCLELLLVLAMHNRQRLPLVWPVVHETLASCMDERAFRSPNPLTDRAVFGLLRVCQRLLPSMVCSEVDAVLDAVLPVVLQRLWL